MKRTILPIVFLLLLSTGACKKSTDSPGKTTADNFPEITSFKFSGLGADSVNIAIDKNKGTIDAILPPGTNLSKLVPEFTVTGNAVAQPGSGSVQDCSAPFSLVLTGADGMHKTYSVAASLQKGVLLGKWYLTSYTVEDYYLNTSIGSNTIGSEAGGFAFGDLYAQFNSVGLYETNFPAFGSGISFAMNSDSSFLADEPKGKNQYICQFKSSNDLVLKWWDHFVPHSPNITEKIIASYKRPK